MKLSKEQRADLKESLEGLTAIAVGNEKRSRIGLKNDSVDGTTGMALTSSTYCALVLIDIINLLMENSK